MNQENILLSLGVVEKETFENRADYFITSYDDNMSQVVGASLSGFLTVNGIRYSGTKEIRNTTRCQDLKTED